VSKEDLRAMRATHSFFYRKFARDSNVEKYALALISEPNAEKYYISNGGRYATAA
jgi:hypothetical protein